MSLSELLSPAEKDVLLARLDELDHVDGEQRELLIELRNAAQLILCELRGREGTAIADVFHWPSLNRRMRSLRIAIDQATRYLGDS